MRRVFKWSQALRWGGCGAVLCSAAALVAQTDTASQPPDAASATAIPADPAGEAAVPTPLRFREGMHLTDDPGHFERAVEGPVFVGDAGHRLTGLENLNLQRIARTLEEAEDPSVLQWKVSGVITEFEGRNFILIERANYSAPDR
jgi:hypothetical protein